MSKHEFQAEVSQLLNLVVHSLYSHQEIFLRELISNASDSLDKLRYLNLSDEKFKSVEFVPRIDIKLNAENTVLEVIDNGIGMSEEELKTSLGTIASSGTKKFLAQLSGEQRKDANLIGQFGVGFYSAFMVADKVEVLTRRADEEQAWLWSSDGKSEFTLQPAEREVQGATVRLFLNENGKEFASRWQLESLVKKFSNHIAFPIYLSSFVKEEEQESEKVEQVNAAAALWKKPRREISEQEYDNFFQNLPHNGGKSLLTVHIQAEGQLEYAALLFVPEQASFDLFQQDYRCNCRLYVQRVLISDDDRELLPTYLRFLVGVIDSEDLPLNVSRELLQKNRLYSNIRNAIVKKVLSEFEKLATQNPEGYNTFIEQYNRLLKEGLYADYQNREVLQRLIRFKSTMADGWTSLAAYKERMKEEQKEIYFVTGNSEKALRCSPLLEGYKNKGFEVLLLSDEIDDFIAPQLGPFEEIPLKAISSSSGDELGNAEEHLEDHQKLIEKLEQTLAGQVKKVVLSKRLTDSAACVVNDQNDPSLHMQQMLKAMGQATKENEILPILEINPKHKLIRQLANRIDEQIFHDSALLLLEQALLLAGGQLKEPEATAQRMANLLASALA